jgi:DNA polymerase (family 10)
MPVQNTEIARCFEQVADLLELQEANPFRIRAYRVAAQTVRGLPRALHDLVQDGEDLTLLPCIGEDLAGKIEELVRSGELPLLTELGRETPPRLAELLMLPGLGPRRVRALHDALGIETRADLLRAARAGRVRALKGFGEKTERGILAALAERPAGGSPRTLWIEAEATAHELVEHLRALSGVFEVEPAGSFRRRRETVGDLDLLASCRRGTRVVEHFIAHEDVARVLARGPKKAGVVLRSGLQVDLRVVPRDSFGAAWLYFTGSTAHNIALRKLARERELKLNEYGLFRGRESLAGKSERGLYRSLGLPFIEPELRENRGELEAARRRSLPRLIERAQIRGDLHAHTEASDGRSSLEDMAAAARDLGYDYLAITDHTRAARIAHGLDARAMRRHLARVEKLGAGLPGLRLLRSAEVDILEDGSLDLPDDLLNELDLVVGAVHSSFQLSRTKQTERLLRAMDHPRFHILAHPSGRLLGEREPYAVDLERLIEGAAQRGCFLELNAQPKRLDLEDIYLKAAKEAGVKVAVSSDAHSAEQLDWMRLGIGQARRGWLTADDVLNARPWGELKRLLRR